MAAFVAVNVRTFLATLPPECLILNAGSSSRRYAGRRTINIDVQLGDVDCVGDIHDLPIQDDAVDVVVCTAVLQYCEDVPRALRELQRVLKPGGLIYIDMPFLQPVCPDRALADLNRYTLTGLQRVAAKYFDIEQSGPSILPGPAISHIVAVWASGMRSRVLAALSERAAWFLTRPLVSIRWNPTPLAAAACYLIGRKPASASPAAIRSAVYRELESVS